MSILLVRNTRLKPYLYTKQKFAPHLATIDDVVVINNIEAINNAIANSNKVTISKQDPLVIWRANSSNMISVSDIVTIDDAWSISDKLAISDVINHW